MANGQVTAGRPAALSAFIALFVAAFLAVFGLALARSPAEVTFLLAAVVGLVVAFMRPDLFLYFVLFTIPFNFTRAYRGFPLALEELKVLGLPLIVLHRWAGGKVVPRLKIKSVYLLPVAGLLLIVLASYPRALSFPMYLHDGGRLVGGICMIWLVLNICTTWRRQKIAIGCLVGGALALALLCFLQLGAPSIYGRVAPLIKGDTYTAFSPTLGALSPGSGGRASGPFNADETGAFMAWLLPVLLCFALAAKRKKARLYVALSTLGLILFLTFSRGAIASAAVGVLLFLALSKKANARLLAVGGAACLLILAALSVPSVQATLNRRLGGTGAIWRSRMSLVRAGVKIISRHPLFGVGIGNLGQTVERQLGENHPGKWILWTIVSTHNQYLDIWIESGLVGLLCYLWIFSRILQMGWTAFRQKSWGPRRLEVTALACGCVTMLIHGFINAVVLFSMVGYVCWAMFGLVEATYRLVKADPKARPAKPPLIGANSERRRGRPAPVAPAPQPVTG
jgi:hypothetical protein